MQRAWVLQERVLSRRTIHFTGSHVYYECEDGVTCEQLTKLKPPFGKQYFILDPQFPDRLYSSGYKRTFQLIQFLFVKYSASGITEETDRAIAINSLIIRIEQALKTSSHYGIFQLFLSSLLLWKRTRDSNPPIKHKKQVPSWSWMAYSGGVDFILEPTDQFLVSHRDNLYFADDGRALHIKVRNFGEGCRVEENGGNYDIMVGTENVGSLWLDMANPMELDGCNCVVVGTLDDEEEDDEEEDDEGEDDEEEDDEEEDARRYYFILVIRDKYESTNQNKDEGKDGNKDRGKRYERIGVGKVQP
ncbi:hypothetical protein QBC38DRAFT_550681, partial [Podospora fimiseda]